LDVRQVESFAAIDNVLEEIRRTYRHFKLLLFLNLLGDSVDLLSALRFDSSHQRFADQACWLLCDEEEHISRLVHVINLAHIQRLGKVCQV